MPNFNTHWLVAIQCLDAAPSYIRDGYNHYHRIATNFRVGLYDKIHAVLPSGKSDDSKDAFKTFRDEQFDRLCEQYEKNIKKKSCYDDITCFSAYMLGACGPDFWTTTSSSKGGVIPDTAGIHFDFGHYNRTHRQFQVAIEHWKGKSIPPLQYKTEVSYFLGMATHIATDLIFHQLVNVYAGAYNLLEKKWESEHGALSGLKNLWNTHNKVEHYWDSYIRYRYLGDYGAFWPKGDPNDIVPPLGLAVVESLIRWVEARKAFKAKSKLLKWLKKESNKLKIEKSFIFPRIACDRITANTVLPFIYDIVVEKGYGAYPKEVVFNEAATEARHYQMTDPRGGYSERRKLAYFTSANNQNTNTCSFNYLNYYVCPSLERTKNYGNHVFYHLNALAPFVNSATLVCRSFVTKLLVAIDKKDAGHIGTLDHFWNLDTGLGLKVSKVTADSTKEAVTELDFVHICDFLQQARIAYRGYTADLKCMSKNGSPKVKTFDTIKYPSPPVRAFKTYPAEKPFADIDAVYEKEAKKKEYLEKIVLERRVGLESQVQLDTFFKPLKQTSVKRQLTETCSIRQVNEIVVADQKHRLTLRFKTAIVPFCAKDKLGFYLLGDKKKKIADSVKFKEGMQKTWLKDSGVQALTLLHADTDADDRQAPFKAHFLINFENEKDLERKIAEGQWNNVIQYQAKNNGFINHKDHYGRNYAISTGRRHVLHPDGDGCFWADKDFKYFKEVTPTEHIFFSLFLLVRTENGCFDMISKEKVAEKDLAAIKKIDCLGFVKIVLFYVLDKNGACQVEACYVDGLKVPVPTKSD